MSTVRSVWILGMLVIPIGVVSGPPRSAPAESGAVAYEIEVLHRRGNRDPHFGAGYGALSSPIEVGPGDIALRGEVRFVFKAGRNGRLDTDIGTGESVAEGLIVAIGPASVSPSGEPVFHAEFEGPDGQLQTGLSTGRFPELVIEARDLHSVDPSFRFPTSPAGLLLRSTIEDRSLPPSTERREVHFSSSLGTARIQF